MLFVVLGAGRPATERQRLERRLKWSYPEGAKIVAEYWLQTPDPNLILVIEADDLAPIMAGTAAWDDLFELRVVPAVTAEQGLEMAKKMMA
jgi:hypothetical protein